MILLNTIQINFVTFKVISVTMVGFGFFSGGVLTILTTSVRALFCEVEGRRIIDKCQVAMDHARMYYSNSWHDNFTIPSFYNANEWVSLNTMSSASLVM